MRDLVTKIHKEKNLTTVLVTHDIGEAMMMSDKVIILENHKILCQGSPSAVLNNSTATEYLQPWKLEIKNQKTIIFNNKK